MNKKKQIKKLRKKLDRNLKKAVQKNGFPTDNFETEYEVYIPLKNFKEALLELLLEMEALGKKMALSEKLMQENGQKQQNIQA